MQRQYLYLSSAVAPLAGQMLSMSQEAAGARALQGQPRVNECRGTAVVIHKEELMREYE